MTYNPKIKNTSKDDMSIDANIDANNITMGEAEDGDWTDGIFAFDTETNVGTAIDKINELLKGLAPKVPSDLNNLSVESTSTLLGRGVSVKIMDAAGDVPIDHSFSNFQDDQFSTSQDHKKLVFARQEGTNVTRLGAFSADATQSIIAVDMNEIGDAIPNGNAEGDSNDTHVNLRDNSFRVVRGKKSTFKLYINGDATIHQYFGEIENTIDDAQELILVSADPASYPFDAKLSLSEIQDGKFLNSGESFDLFQSRTATLSFPGDHLKNGHNFFRLSHEIEGEGEVFTNYVDFFRDLATKEGATKTFSLDPNPANDYVEITYDDNPKKYLSGIHYYTDGGYLCQGSIENFGSDVYSAKTNGGIRRAAASATTGLSVTSHFSDTDFDTVANIYNFNQSNNNSIQISHEPQTRLFASPPEVIIALEDVYNNATERVTLVVNLNNQKLMFDNFGQTSNGLVENFDDEVYREKVDSIGDLSQTTAGTSDWDSAVDLTSNDMVIALGQLQAQANMVNSLTDIQDSNPQQRSTMNFIGDPTEDAYYIRKFVRSSGFNAGKLVVELGKDISSSPSGNDVVIVDTTGTTLDIELKNQAGEWKSVLLNTGIRAANQTSGANLTQSPNGTLQLGFDLGQSPIPAEAAGGGSIYMRIKTNQSFIGSIKKIELVHS